MIVCHCKRVTDREIKAAIESGARCERDVARATGAGTRCGGCRPAVEELVSEHRPVRNLVLLPMAG